MTKPDVRQTPQAAALLALLLTVAACSAQPAQPAADSPSPAATQATESSPWLPREGEGGWSRAGGERKYGPGNLWEYIDGAADGYLAQAFQELVTADFVRPGGERVTVDVYRMEAPLGAFGIYAQELPPAPSFVAVGSEGYVHGTVLNFWAGACYVKVTSATAFAGLPGALESLGAAIAKRVGPSSPRPAEFARFPAAGLVAHSFRVVPQDVAGQSYLPRGFEAQYKDGPAIYRAILIPFATADEASRAFSQYRSFSARAGAVSPVARLGEAAFAGTDGFYGLVVAARAGRSLALVLGAPSERAARRVLLPLL